MGTQQVIKLAETLIAQGVKKARYVTPTCRVGTAEQLGLKLEQLASDTVQIHKSPLSEITSYLQGVSREGKGFIPTFENPNSAFAKYFSEIETYNAVELAKGTRKIGSFTISPKTKFVNLNDFKDFIHANAETLNVSKQEYWQLVDELSSQIKKEVTANPNGLRQDFVENADKIHKWAEIFRTQHKYPDGKESFSKYYDEQMFNKAVEQYKEFVEQVTGKKVFIGCPSRMNFPIAALSLLNCPKAYKDVDFILLGHGKNSSLITDITNPNTWRFSDNDKSIWEFIENVCAGGKKGKKGLVFSCETDGLAKAGKTAEEMIDQDGQKMFGIGNEVMSTFVATNPAKIVESGIRHIKGHRYLVTASKDSPIGSTECVKYGRAYTLQPITEIGTIDYNLDFSKYQVENLI